MASPFNWLNGELAWRKSWFDDFDLPWRPGEDGGGYGGGGGGQNTSRIRNIFLNQVLGDKSKNIADRIGDENSPCWKYLQEIIDKLGISSLSSPKDLIKHLNDAAYDVMGDENGDFSHGRYNMGQNGKNCRALTTTSGSLGTGNANKVVLGAKFYGRQIQVQS